MRVSDFIIVLGAVVVIVGLLVRAGVPLGHLPGDINIKGDSYSIYIPIMTSILVSILLTAIFYLTDNL